MTKYFWMFCAVLLQTLAANAQQKDPLSVSVERDTVALGEWVAVTFEMENASLDDFTPPRFSDFEQDYGKSVSSKVSLRDGKMEQSVSVTYRLKPLQTGTFSIEPAVLRVAKKEYRTGFVKITVVEQGELPAAPPQLRRPSAPTRPERKVYKI